MREEKVGSLVRSSLWDCCEYLGLVWTPTLNWRTSVPSVRSCWHGHWRQLKRMALTSSGLLRDWQDLTENFFSCPQKHSQKVEWLDFCCCCFTFCEGGETLHPKECDCSLVGLWVSQRRPCLTPRVTPHAVFPGPSWVPRLGRRAAVEGTEETHWRGHDTERGDHVGWDALWESMTGV